MMAGKFKVLLGESEDLRCRLLELPFRGKRLSMFFLLPDEEIEARPSPLRHLERNLTAHNLKKLFSTLRVLFHRRTRYELIINSIFV
jgi:serine protease inhibitor